MSIDPTYSRRMLLSHGVGAALALPVTLRAAAHPATGRVEKGAAFEPLVVLDPGHGGRDPGAVGACGTCEKHIAFAIAGETPRTLRAARGVRVGEPRGAAAARPPNTSPSVGGGPPPARGGRPGDTVWP